MKQKIFILVFLMWAFTVRAVEFETVPLPPDLPEPVQSGEPLDIEVIIRHRADATIEEYRANGSLYAVKIIPAVGPAYYLIDHDGDGTMETRSNDLDENLVVPQWVIFSW